MRKEVFEVQFPSVEFLLLAAVDCGGLDSPTNGTVRVTGTRFGFYCDLYLLTWVRPNKWKQNQGVWRQWRMVRNSSILCP